jgi:RND superfamily putative drug exporter
MPKKIRLWLPLALVVLVWLAGAGPLGQYTGKLSEVQSNDSSTFLPATAESTRVGELRKGFEDRSTTPAVLVWESRGEIDDAAVERAAAAVRRIQDEGLAVQPPSPPIRSEDGRALTAFVPLDADAEDPPSTASSCT